MDEVGKELAAIASKAAWQAIKAAKERDPRFARYSVKADAFAAKRKPAGWSKHPQRILSGMLGHASFRALSNDKIAETVSGWYDGVAVSPSIMTKKFSPSMRKSLQEILDKAGQSIRVRPDDTLSTLKQAIRGGGRDKPNAEGTITVVYGDGYVVLNGKTYKVDPSREAPSIRVAAKYLRVDILRALTG